MIFLKKFDRLVLKFTQKKEENENSPVKIDRVEAEIQAYTHTHTRTHTHTHTHTHARSHARRHTHPYRHFSKIMYWFLLEEAL